MYWVRCGTCPAFRCVCVRWMWQEAVHTLACIGAYDHSSFYLPSMLSFLFCPKFLVAWCYVTGRAISFAIGLGSPSFQLRVIDPFTYCIINMTHFLFFFLLFIAGNQFDQNQWIIKPAIKKVMKPRGSDLTALVAFLHAGRYRSLPSLEMKLLLTACVGGEQDLQT